MDLIKENYPTVKGIDAFIDEFSELGSSPLTPHGRDCVRTILLAFSAHVKRHQRLKESETNQEPEWGRWLAWLVNGAPDRDEGIAAAKWIVEWRQQQTQRLTE